LRRFAVAPMAWRAHNVPMTRTWDSKSTPRPSLSVREALQKAGDFALFVLGLGRYAAKH
jgi:hypothetical protein